MWTGAEKIKHKSRRMSLENSTPISFRAAGMHASSIRKLSSVASETEKRGVKVYHLNIGQPDLKTPKRFYTEVRKFAERTLAYAPSEGYTDAISAWKDYYHKNNIPFESEDIIVTTGGSEAIIFTLMTVADPGDEVIIFEPLYANYITYARMASVIPVPVQTFLADGFHLPPDELIEKKITKKTKAIIICNPSNPTGTVYTREELGRIAALAKKHNIFIIADEVYREIVFEGKAVSMMEFKKIQDRIIIVDSVSKRFNICGARIGCVASKNKSVMENVLKFAQGRLSSPTIDQLAVVPLLQEPAKYITPMVKEYKKRRDVVAKYLQKIPGVKFYLPQGALYLIAELPIANAEYFCRWLLEEFSHNNETVMFAPAAGFYETKGAGKNEIRIAFVLETEQLKRAMEILKIALEEYK